MRSFRRPICNNYHARVYAVAHADSPAMVEAHPTGTTRGVYERIQNGPVGYGITSIRHGLGFPVGTGYRAGIQVIAPDNYGCFYFPGAHQFIECETGLFP